MPQPNASQTKRQVAEALAEKVFKSNNGNLSITKYLDTQKERAFVVHLLNGPGADWVMDKSSFRWISSHRSDFSNIRTLADFASYCEAHLV